MPLRGAGGRGSAVRMAAKSLHAMLNKFKVAGAHPDIITALDPEKASHNGQALIQLEQLLQRRTTPPGATEAPHDRHEEHRLTFWLKRHPQSSALLRIERWRPTTPGDADVGTQATTATGSDHLHTIACNLTPYAPDRIVKEQLTQLFRSAGVDEDFELPKSITSPDMQSVLDDVRTKHDEHLQATKQLFVRGNRSIQFLRSFGVVLTLEDRGSLYLLTLPDRFEAPGVDHAMDHGAASGQNIELRSEAREFLRERNLIAFDFRMVGSYGSVEQIVMLIERLERLYREHRGTCLRPGATYCLALTGEACGVSEDGQIVLPALAPHTWEEYCLMLPQPKWDEIVRLHRDWRADNPMKLREFNARAARVANTLQYHSLTFEYGGVSASRDWQYEFMRTVLREEGAVRNTVQKYGAALQVETLKTRGTLYVRRHVFRDGLTEAKSPNDPQVVARMSGDGRVHVNASMVPTPIPLLKALKQLNAAAGEAVLAFDAAMAELGSLSRRCMVEITIDPVWRDRCTATELQSCIKHFAVTTSSISGIIARTLEKSERRGLMLVVSDRFQVMPSGKALVPWDADVGELRNAMISR